MKDYKEERRKGKNSRNEGRTYQGGEEAEEDRRDGRREDEKSTAGDEKEGEPISDEEDYVI
ncbi:hypothetical protein EYF80_004569 [Liparis tanakae]|uniref:Uncharacterized protein n=1 Tax=Liparis tanakae TaxID=230148 RepID=A0A4Z2J4T8_9TELE|nr:hypothetical protein EYF80_004569 [Liparis tanakae]